MTTTTTTPPRTTLLHSKPPFDLPEHVPKAFVGAAAKEVQGGGLEGLNFGYQPRNIGDSTAYIVTFCREDG